MDILKTEKNTLVLLFIRLPLPLKNRFDIVPIETIVLMLYTTFTCVSFWAESKLLENSDKENLKIPPKSHQNNIISEVP